MRRTPWKKSARGTRRFPFGPRDDRLGLQRHQRRRHVRGRGRIAQVAAHGGEVANLDRSDEGAALGEGGIVFLYPRVQLDLAGRHRRTHTKSLPVDAKASQEGHAGQIDHERRSEQSVLELGQQVRPARDDLGVGAALGEGFQTVVDAAGQR